LLELSGLDTSAPSGDERSLGSNVQLTNAEGEAGLAGLAFGGQR
jgi:hypothetical protein